MIFTSDCIELGGLCMGMFSIILSIFISIVTAIFFVCVRSSCAYAGLQTFDLGDPQWWAIFLSLFLGVAGIFQD
jgi:hypothetical protein